MLHVLIDLANSAAARWLTWVVAATLDSAVLLVVIGLVWWTIRNRVAPQVGYCLFLMIPLKLLVPVTITVPLALARWSPSAFAVGWIEQTPVPERTEKHAADSMPITVAQVDRPVVFEEPNPVANASPRPKLNEPQVAPTVPSRRQEVAEPMARLSVAAVAMLAWLGAASLLLVRFAAMHLRFRAQVPQSVAFDHANLAIDLPELCCRARLPETIQILESDQVAAPSVWRILRPTILLPHGLASNLTAQQLRWTLLHEFAHIRRRDLIVVALQRLAAIVHFFNPAIWVANRVIDQLREYACDDLAVVWSGSTSVESGEAFVRNLEHAVRSPRGLDGALGIFGLDSRACCLRRVHRLLDADRTIRTKAGALSIAALILFAAVAVPHLRAAREGPAPTPTNVGQEFELLIMRPDGKPIPDGRVELSDRTTCPVPTSKSVVTGKLIRVEPLIATLASDSEGRLRVKLEPVPANFNIDIRIPGYAPWTASWPSLPGHDEPIPARLTAQLEPAWSIGGVIVDSDGKPIEGVNVHHTIWFKTLSGDNWRVGRSGTMKTDAAGRWHYDSVPLAMEKVGVTFDHPSYMPMRWWLSRPEFDVTSGRWPTDNFVLERGVTVTGRVTDESRKPIAGALIRTKFSDTYRKATTASDGTYKLVGCEPVKSRIVVSAKGRAYDMKQVKLDPTMGPLNFAMRPGGTLRIRVLDDQGNPVPKAWLHFRSWSGQFEHFEFDPVGTETDESGRWIWHEAPLDELQVDIHARGRWGLNEQRLIARKDEYVLRLPAPVVISGRVIDAVTKEPIESFRVVPGLRVDNRSPLTWQSHQSFAVKDGFYQVDRSRSFPGEAVRIEAPGYQPAVSREIQQGEGSVTINFELTRGQDIVGTVVTPDGRPAAGAKVALANGVSQILVQNGDFDRPSTVSNLQICDDQGRFQFTPQDTTVQLVVVHPSGYAEIRSSAEWDASRKIRLKPWARVEGTFRVGKQPVADVAIQIHTLGHDSHGRDGASIFTIHEARTGADGRLVFDRVLPGKGQIFRRLNVIGGSGPEEVTSSIRVNAEFPGGKTTRIDLGGTGRPVVGELRPPLGFQGKVYWNLAMIDVEDDRTDIAWITAAIAEDGTFRLDDVPAGNYTLRVRFQWPREAPGSLSDYRFQVPPAQGDGPVKPVDLGMLRLKALQARPKPSLWQRLRGSFLGTEAGRT
jgi:beta-lactamase regulating signal transducer with metallopeptidase domain/uncharacterized GH25 family protein